MNHLLTIVLATIATFSFIPVLEGATCDPMYVGKLLANDGSFLDSFCLVEIDGDTAIVGAFLDDPQGSDSGSAYIFVRSGDTWIQQQKLTANDGGSGDWFGTDVDVEGDIAVVGAPAHNNLGADCGAAYVFIRSGTTWTLQQKLNASDGKAGDWFGIGVDISGDTILVGADGGAINCDNGVAGPTCDSGAAYVFMRVGNNWIEQQKLTAPTPAGNDAFGTAVSLQSDSAIIGARGAAHVFARNGSQWIQQQTLTPEDNALGISNSRMDVTIDGDTAILGPDGYDGGAGEYSGAAFVFVRSGETWSQQQKLTPADAAPNDYFGFGLALQGDVAVIASFLDDVGQVTDAGSVYIFVRSGSTWSQQAKVIAHDGEALDYFGAAVAMSGTTVIVGSQFDSDVNFAAGSAYIFEVNCSPSTPGDITGDGVVNVADLLSVINAWGPCPAPPATCDADIAPSPDGDGQVNVSDLLFIINNWG